MPDLAASLTQLGAQPDHLVVGLDDGQFGESSFQSATPQLTRSGA
jgi:hypothetical protein